MDETRQRRNRNTAAMRRHRSSQSAYETSRNHARNLSTTLPQTHNAGKMEGACSFCNANYLLKERTTTSVFTKCCRGGKVILSDLQIVPEDILQLYTGSTAIAKNFQTYLRQYNNAFAMASWNADISIHMGRGPKVVTIHGQTYHATSSMDPIEGQQRKFAQLYALDSRQAIQERLSLPANAGTRQDVIEIIQSVLELTNPLVHQFQSMGDILNQQRIISSVEGTEIPPIRMVISHTACEDPRHYNDPVAAEIAAIFIGNEEAPPDPSARDIVIYPTSHQTTQRISPLSSNVDPLTYPLSFLYGERGWGGDLRQTDVHGNLFGTRITLRQYYSYRIAVRSMFSPIHLRRLLFHQYLVDAFCKVDGNELNFVRKNQVKLRADSYQGLIDHLNNRAEQQGSQLRKYGKPDIFLIFTANSKWKEVLDALAPHQTRNDGPDIVSRVFNIKLSELKHDILKNNILGKIIAHVYTVEFQKRGLPHVHLLIFLLNRDKRRTPEDVDLIVSAEVPNPDIQPDLYDKVKRHMIHGPCGIHNPNSICMKNNACQKNFPKEPCKQTTMEIDGYPHYRRRQRFPSNITSESAVIVFCTIQCISAVKI